MIRIVFLLALALALAGCALGPAGVPMRSVDAAAGTGIVAP